MITSNVTMLFPYYASSDHRLSQKASELPVTQETQEVLEAYGAKKVYEDPYPSKEQDKPDLKDEVFISHSQNPFSSVVIYDDRGKKIVTQLQTQDGRRISQFPNSPIVFEDI